MKFTHLTRSVTRILSACGLAAALLNGCAVDTEEDVIDDAFVDAEDAETSSATCDALCLHEDSDLDVDACYDSCEAAEADDGYRSVNAAACGNDWRCLCRVYRCHTYH
ncbi:MAG: hypothetical protein AAGN82_15625 [Myxococcota bacterium]